jgi:REP element-mobilizing transposase RayT
MARGIAREEIFLDDRDRQEFVSRLENLLRASGCKCLAWALVPNHIHLLVRRGARRLVWLMQRLLLGYALYFNGRHGRAGHLFQNRYKSVLCEEAEYLAELVRYIHLNPLRAGAVEDLGSLESYAWCGHGALVGRRSVKWQAVTEVLRGFGKRRSAARAAYRRFAAAGVAAGQRGELGTETGPRAEWRLSADSVARRGRTGDGDVRILGGRGFVTRALKRWGAGNRVRGREGREVTPERALARAARKAGVAVREVYGGAKRRRIVRARALACRGLSEASGLSGVEIARMLGITPAAVCRILGADERG